MRLISNLITIVMAFHLSSSTITTATQSSNNLETFSYVKFNAFKKRGSSSGGYEGNTKRTLIKRENSDSTLDANLVNGLSIFYVEISIGSNNQNISLAVDTGSSDMWVVSENNNICSNSSKSVEKSDQDYARFNKRMILYDAEGEIEDWGWITTGDPFSYYEGSATFTSDSTQTDYEAEATNDCYTYGTFNPSKSNTFHNNGTSFSISYSDGSSAEGTFGYDNVNIQGVDVSNLSFAVVDKSTSVWGVLGIGYRRGESTFKGMYGYIYQNLPEKMKSLGLIKKNTYSLYLTDIFTGGASLLFGGVDHNKYTGTLLQVPIVNRYYYFPVSLLFPTPPSIEVTLNSITLGNFETGTQIQIASGRALAALDSGTTLALVPSNILKQLISQIPLKYTSTLGGYAMECEKFHDYYLSFNFQGSIISIPLDSFSIGVMDEPTGKFESYCVLGITTSGDDTFTLGDTFLDSVYSVIDLDSNVVAMAPADLVSTDENIEPIKNDIPSASKAPDYSNTWELFNKMTTIESLTVTTATAANLPVTPTTTSLLQFKSTYTNTVSSSSSDYYKRESDSSENSASGSNNCFLSTSVIVILNIFVLGVF